MEDQSPTKRKEEQTFFEVDHHNNIGFDETEKRSTGVGRIGSISFDEADELFRSYIDEKSWPYDALLFDPRIFTFIFEKTSRLIASKPRAHLIPREGSDILGAKVNNVLLDFQWDQATHSGTMLQKWALMDINARKYGASFGLAKWRYERDSRGEVIFDGPDMQVLNNRDFAHDLAATSIEGANWVQVRQYVTFNELERVNDANRKKPIYKNMDTLRFAIGKQDKQGKSKRGGGGDSRAVNWTSRNREISNLEVDPVGKDIVFKTIEIVTEYQKDRWITFAPKHGVVLRDIKNPYGNYEIPVTMLRYYVIDDDLYGLSEIEPVKGLQKAINALLCQYVDEINQNLYSPIAIGPGVRQHTLEWGKGARWIMNNPLTDFRLVESKSNAAQFFNNTYSVLVAAMMSALGESSLGVSNLQPMQNEKTATEVKALTLQRNARDNYNQLMLGDAMKRQIMLWHTMNQKLIFSDKKKRAFAVRIVGRDALKYFKEKGLQDKVLSDEAVKAMGIFADTLGVKPEELQDKGIDLEKMQFPKFPVNMSEKEGDFDLVPKLNLSEDGESGELQIEPEDVQGMFDFSIDVQSMTVNSDEERRQARQTAVSLLVSNPNIIMLLQQEGVKPKFKELFISWLDDLGFTDAERYFEQTSGTEGPAGAGGGEGQSIQELLKQFGGGDSSQGQQVQALQGATPPAPGAGANQLAKVTGQGPQQPQRQATPPNPEVFRRLTDRYGSQTNPPAG